MQPYQAHIIRKQNIRVNATVGDGFALKQKIERFAEDLAPRLSDLFDTMVSENEWLQIDKLDIEIDDLCEEELEVALTYQILQKIQNKIAAGNYSASVIGGKNYSGISNIRPKGKEEDECQIVSVHQRSIVAFVYFLKHGILPWWFEITSHSIFEEQVLIAISTVLKNKNKANQLIIAEIQDVFSHPPARKRLMGQFNQQIYLEVVRLVSQAIGTDAFSKITKVFQVIQQNVTLNVEDQVAGSNSSSRQYQDISKQVLHFSKIDLLESLNKSQNTTELLKNWFVELSGSVGNKLLKNLKSILFENSELKKYFTKDLEDSLFGPVSENFSAAVKEARTADSGNMKSHKSIEELAKEEGLIISNAGLVIMAPFLPQLFEHCGIIENHKITDRNKAIALMHFTIYGNCDYREYDVLLNKILCGLDGSDSLEAVYDLSDDEKSQAEHMLTSVIGHWSALKGTSPDGLREGFLIRKGSLIYKHEQWFLQVEQKVIDLLLDQLPWTIGFVKLPWMKTMLKTHWR